MATSDDYPGRMIPDSERSMYGLGWEHKRRGEKPHDRYLKHPEYLSGHFAFNCSDPKTNLAMLTKGVEID